MVEACIQLKGDVQCKQGCFLESFIGAIFMELFHVSFKIGSHSHLFCSECCNVLIRDGEWDFDRDVRNKSHGNSLMPCKIASAVEYNSYVSLLLTFSVDYADNIKQKKEEITKEQETAKKIIDEFLKEIEFNCAGR